MTPAGLVIEVRSLQVHEASQARVELAKVRERMKEMAQSSAFASAGQIFHASIGSCSNEVLAILPKESVNKRTINNHKALLPIGLVGVICSVTSWWRYGFMQENVISDSEQNVT